METIMSIFALFYCELHLLYTLRCLACAFCVALDGTWALETVFLVALGLICKTLGYNFVVFYNGFFQFYFYCYFVYSVYDRPICSEQYKHCQLIDSFYGFCCHCLF